MRQTEVIAQQLAEAFIEDPLICWFFPKRETRVRNMFYTFRLVAGFTLDQGNITPLVDTGTITGAALWLPSDRLHQSLLTQLRYGGIQMLVRQTPAAVLRQMRCQDQMLSQHNRLLAEPHQYLYALGINHCSRGKGFATALLEPGLERAAKLGQPCYLDTNNPDNVSLYRRYGFEVVHHGILKGTRVDHWAMVRPAN